VTPAQPEVSLTHVSVIVVLYNSGDIVAGGLQALPPEVEVVVVDNDSSDDGGLTAGRIRPDARIIRTDHNLGFGGGCQLGASAATRPLLLFLNPDAEIGGPDILTLATMLGRHPHSLVGPRLLDSGRSPRPIRHELDIRKDALWLLPASGRWFHPSWRLQPEPDLDAEHEVPFVEGACFLIRRSDLIAIGGFDPDLFLYFEESSIAHRLKQRGGTVWYEPRAVARHAGETSTRKVSGLATFHFYRSRVIFERKVFHGVRGKARCLPLLATALIAVITGLAQQAIRRRPGAAAYAIAAVRGTVAGLRARIGSGY
jgi:N-acetylglucosaminyl-diphospho-decaprenol L-rhamnosyltransferase